ncbi:MAG: VWA domain-containing protein [Williamsia sp.]|nr:VWA domain-containing protein [Williamsia sp.]
MINKFLLLLLVLFFVLASCEKSSTDLAASYSADVAAGVITPPSSGGQGGQSQPGVITAGEWNDLDHWSFLDTLLGKEQFKTMPGYWNFYPNNRISVVITGTDGSPLVDIPVKLKRNGTIVFTSRTDNKGKAELWADLFQENKSADFSTLALDINNGARTISNVKAYKDGINQVVLSPLSIVDKIEVAFMVDATGSMGDELEYLKTELYDVIARVKAGNPRSSLVTSAVFYRDEKDEYVTRVSNFTSDINATIGFIKNQKAAGGGDFPEAVHSALEKSVNELQWSANAKTRLLFILLDAPPHYTTPVISNLQTSLTKAAEKGVKVIPITASGIDKQTEFLMRFMALTTNGTYVFITNHSGIGNAHLEASVGEYQVEYLNNLMVRLINKYAQ